MLTKNSHYEVYKYITEYTGDVVDDIQRMLDHVCIHKCKECRFTHLCVREENKGE